ncbi:MAG: preprotein translocase subunit SecA [Bacillota bacterium]
MLKKLFDPSRRQQKKLAQFADLVIAKHETYKSLSDDDIKAKTDAFKTRIKNGESLDDLAVEAFALVREASIRVTNMEPFKVQIMGAKVIHEGNIAEMKTGEGKTLTAVMPAYLNALTGDGVHIVTVNDYLAGREVDGEIGDLFRFLGLSVGLNTREMSKEEKREAYNCDILYSTNNELGFDYLRDHMVIYKEDMVQRPLSFAIIDEVDSILIDEARTPLIISGGAKNTANLYLQAQAFVRTLMAEADYEIDIKSKTVSLTPEGIAKAERHFSIDNLYDIDHVGLLHHINNAIKANYTMEKDVDYVVQDNKVIIVDSFTGRLMHGRQFSEGLHQALEAKEGVEIKKETSTLATITFQNFFRMYAKLSGMTGTAKTEEEEFRNIYNMLVIEIPTNKPVIRQDDNDVIFATMKAKFNAIADEIKIRNDKGQPMLVGTISIETSELLSKLLKRRGVKHSVLNAKQHEKEAQIVEDAGKKGSVTIATNMAGRGTDIKLGPGVVELGGLAVLGTERHESRRIDNQLRGRSGRQGDPGYSKFFLSAEDELLRRFGGDSFKKRLEMITKTKGSDKEAPISFGIFSRFVQRAQKQIEGNNFDRRKTVLQYDEVLRKQREVIYQQRRDILQKASIMDIAEDIVYRQIDNMIMANTNQDKRTPSVDVNGLFEALNGKLFNPGTIDKNQLSQDVETTQAYLKDKVTDDLSQKRKLTGDDKYNEFLKAVLLRVVDTYWVQHIDQMSELRQSIRLRSYAQQNPLREYQEIGYEMFEELIASIERDATRYVLRAVVRNNLERVQVAKPTSTYSGKEEDAKRTPRRVEKVGRNDPCPCGSGKKFKHCHGR